MSETLKKIILLAKLNGNIEAAVNVAYQYGKIDGNLEILNSLRSKGE